jgi:biotin carboxyl carrier protein
MSRFDTPAIEKLIAKAKSLGLTRLRVAEEGNEVSIELPRSARSSSPVSEPVSEGPVIREVASQYVGYFRPGAEPGATLAKDEAIGVVESLGLPNDVLAPAAGTLSTFLVGEGDAVEYGTVIARIET